MTLLAVVGRACPSVPPKLTLLRVISIFAAMLAVAVGNARPSEAQSSARLTRVQVLDAPHATAIHLHIDGEPASFRSEVVDDPSQLVLTLEGTINATGQSQIEAGGPRAATIRVEGAGEGRLRVVVVPGRAVDPFRNYGVSPTDLGVLLTVGVGELVLRPEPVTPSQAQEPLGVPDAVAVPDESAPTPAPVPPTEEVRPEPGFREATDREIATREPGRADGLVYPVGEVRIEYARIAEGQPQVDSLLALDVDLLRTPQGYVAPRQGIQSETLPIARPSGLPAANLYGSAIRAMNQAIVDEFNRQGLVGVLVLPHEEDIDPSSSRDLRDPGNTTLRLVIWTGRLLEFRTFASGKRIPEEERIDNPTHQRIKDGSPVRPGELLNKKELDEYVSRLNRHPGRTVDMTLTKSLEPGGVYLDFLVAENRPWNVYFQSSNTGTKETSDWRQRFGLAHNQLTGRDDILRFDYVTGDFDTVNAVFGSYEIPFLQGRLEKNMLRARVNGSWSQYDASEVGSQNANFEGEQWSSGGQLLGTIFQHRDLFLDLFGGMRYQHIDNTNDPLPGFQRKTSGTAKFTFGEVGLRLERRSVESRFNLTLSGESNIPGIAGTSGGDLDNDQMGRTNVTERTPQFLRWQALAAFYLEPLFPSYEDPTTPGSSTLAHEIFLQARGQHTEDRVIPYQQSVIGGLNTVRGYRQSLLAADQSVIYRVEYRLHVPRLFGIEPTPRKLPVIGDFRLAPQQVFGRPDWDFIIRPFMDGAWAKNNDVDPRSGEFETEGLVGMGIGVELQILSNLVTRFDYGAALLEAGDNDVGNDEFYFSITLVY